MAKPCHHCVLKKKKYSRRKKEKSHYTEGLYYTLYIQNTNVMNCDKIAVLDKGKICALGTHRELYENCHIYRQFCESQKAGVS